MTDENTFFSDVYESEKKSPQKNFTCIHLIYKVGLRCQCFFSETVENVLQNTSELLTSHMMTRISREHRTFWKNHVIKFIPLSIISFSGRTCLPDFYTFQCEIQ